MKLHRRDALKMLVGGAGSLLQAFGRSSNPDAPWFPAASFGLFSHWGIHSVAGIQPSWAMIKGYPAGGDPRFHPPEKYYALAKEFNPQHYDPDKWLSAAAKAGFTYSVLTTKHHDGYALWPTKYGEMNTRVYMGGRDLLKPWVEACRRHGLRVGFYFSPRDWSYPGFPVGDVDFDYSKRGKFHAVEPAANARNFEKFYEYTLGQLGELLSNYGKIDILWFDGLDWPGIKDLRREQTLARARKLQPGIVINDRWDGGGDFSTVEVSYAKARPTGWWEYCTTWNGHWGYNPNGKFLPASWVIETLVKTRAWGGNFLLNVGPAPDGTMPGGFYERCGEISAWMTHNCESLIGAQPSPGDSRSNAPITLGEHRWYIHVLPTVRQPVEVRDVPRPQSVNLLASGAKLTFRHVGGILRFEVPQAQRTALDDVVVIQ
jgi:alpha-L-fucosidase